MKLSARNVALVVPVVLVNAVAVWGQVLWGHEKLTTGVTDPRLAWGLALLFAVTVESVGVYLAVEAHAALMAGDASGFLRVGAYAVATLAGVLNYSHWVGSNETAAVAFGLMSCLSPWLWSIRSRSLHRAHLRSLGLVEPRAVKFARARWMLWTPRTWRVFRAAVWAGESDPVRALDRFDARHATAAPSATPPKNAVSAAVPSDRRKAEPPARPTTSATPPATPAAKPPRQPAKKPAARSATPPASDTQVADRWSGTQDEQVAALADELRQGAKSVPEIRLMTGWSEGTARRRLAAAEDLLADGGPSATEHAKDATGGATEGGHRESVG